MYFLIYFLKLESVYNSFSIQESTLYRSFFLQKHGLSTSASPETSNKENGNTVPRNGGSKTNAEPTAETNGRTGESGFISGC